MTNSFSVGATPGRLLMLATNKAFFSKFVSESYLSMKKIAFILLACILLIAGCSKDAVEGAIRVRYGHSLLPTHTN